MAFVLALAGCTDGRSPFAPGPGGSEAVLVGAGDIAVCGSPGTVATARLLDEIPGTVFTAGDNAYPHGTPENFRDCYEPTWGRHKGRTYPSPGNHEYETPGASPYFAYFGANAGPAGLGYYRYELATWYVYSLNSNVDVGAASPQLQWLRRNLMTEPATCTLAYFHHTLVSSGPHGGQPALRELWRLLHEFGVDVVITAHEHFYERFTPQDPNGMPDLQRGIRQFVVGTGGAQLYGFLRPQPNSEARITEFGVLRLTLRPDSYRWEFLSADGGAVRDAGIGVCH